MEPIVGKRYKLKNTGTHGYRGREFVVVEITPKHIEVLVDGIMGRKNIMRNRWEIIVEPCKPETPWEGNILKHKFI